MNNLGDNLRTLRKRWKMNQDEFGALLGVGRSQVAKYETGASQVPLESMLLVVQSSGVTFEDLLTKELKPEDFSIMPGGTAVQRPAAAVVQASGELGEFADLRNLAAEVRGLRLDMDLVKKLVGNLDEKGIRKLNLLGLVQAVIADLEEEVGDGEMSKEKKEYLSALAALGRMDAEK